MSLLFWRSSEPPDESSPGSNSLEVNEQHALPVGIYFRDDEAQEAEVVTDNNPLPVVMKPHQANSIALAPVSVSLTVITLLAPANPTRRSVMLTNETGTAAVRIQFSASGQSPPTLTTTTGQYLHSAAGSNITIYGQNAVWGLTVATAAQTLSVLEESETY